MTARANRTIACLALAGMTALAACESSTEPREEIAVATVQLDSTALTLSPAESSHLALTVVDVDGAVVDGDGAPLTWASSNPAVASVSDAGVVEALAPGTTVIRVEADTAHDSLTLRVVASWATVAAGSGRTCGITPAGRLYCWGAVEAGGEVPELVSVPMAIAPEVEWSSVTAGVLHMCAVAVGGDGYCWGENRAGQLGDGTDQDRLVPTPVAGGHKFASITPGRETTCGVTTAGDAYCWGKMADGRLGNGIDDDLVAFEPDLVLDGHTYAKVGVGTAVGCGLTTNGDVYCWGQPALGTGSIQSSSTPLLVAGGHELADLAVAFNTACGLTVGRELWCWGQNYAGLLDANESYVAAPARLASAFEFAGIFASPVHMCGLAADGRAYCWGSNVSGQLGAPAGRSSPTPLEVDGDHAFTSLSAGEDHTCGMTSGGAAYCWGAGAAGQLGAGTLENSTGPVRVLHPGDE